MVGNKSDLNRKVERRDAEKLCQKYAGKMHYFESSAKSSKIENVHEVFKSSIDWALAYRDEKT